MALFPAGKSPDKYQDDHFVRIDIVRRERPKDGSKQNVVRFEAAVFDRFNDPEKYQWEEHTLAVRQPLLLIRRFCVDYQKQNASYSESSNNCRAFMINLCKYTGVPFDAQWPCEELLFEERESMNSDLSGAYETNGAERTESS